jgi:hypothetical protein
MALLQSKPAGYEDLFDLPENVIGEIINGRLSVQPRPAPEYAMACSSLGMEIGSPFQRGKDGPGGWWIFDERNCTSATTFLSPILPAGAASARPPSPRPPTSNCRPIGSAKSFRHRQRVLTVSKSCRFTQPTVSNTPGWLPLTGERWKSLKT